MAGALITAIVATLLLFTGILVVSNQDRNDVSVKILDEENKEGFFDSLDVLMDGLDESTQGVGETKEERYQNYLEAQE